MSGEFLGTYFNSVNKQKWITIPADFKKRFNSQAKQKVVITIGPVANIAIYPLDNWQVKKDQLNSGSTDDKELLMHLITFASSSAQKFETNGRIKIGDDLLEIAGIKDKVVIKGEGNYISVWNPDRYKEYRDQQLEKHKRKFSALDYQ